MGEEREVSLEASCSSPSSTRLLPSSTVYVSLSRELHQFFPHLYQSLVFPDKDIYGGAEDVVGSYKRAYGGKDDQGLFYTK